MTFWQLPLNPFSLLSTFSHNNSQYVSTSMTLWVMCSAKRSLVVTSVIKHQTELRLLSFRLFKQVPTAAILSWYFVLHFHTSSTDVSVCNNAIMSWFANFYGEYLMSDIGQHDLCCRSLMLQQLFAHQKNLKRLLIAP